MSELKIGFVGAGGNANGHMTRVAAIEGASITGICDIDSDRAGSAAAEFGATAYTDHMAMLNSESLDALYVSIPPFAHTDAEIQAAGRGIHVFVEKPVHLSMDAVLEICEAIDQAGIISCVGYQLRYLDTTQRLKRWLSGKTIGLVTTTRWGGLPGTPWWRVMAESGGQLVEQTTHQTDLMRYFAGEVTEVSARYALRTMNDQEGLDIPDAQALWMKFASGAIGTATTSCMAVDGGGRGDLDILLRSQSVGWGTSELYSSPEVPELADPYEETINIDQAFVDAIRTGDQSKVLSSYLDGAKSLDLTLAANESAEKDGEPVKTRLGR
ncbi:MAG TPA: Gfo/Idh/MocA family oxidoreductase [Armatimonadota bacterium]|nr:Gfo/Idh/MocA family oxidoreductase [Armatimonadota bacterium]